MALLLVCNKTACIQKFASTLRSAVLTLIGQLVAPGDIRHG